MRTLGAKDRTKRTTKPAEHPVQLPGLRVSSKLYNALEGSAKARGITLAEAHRMLLQHGLDTTRP